MTTDARGLFDRASFLYNNVLLPAGFVFDFDPIAEIEQTDAQARNFLFLEDDEALFLNDGFVRDFVEGDGSSDVVISNTGVIGSSGRADTSISLTGTGQRAILNEGDVIGDVQLGLGDDFVYTAGLIDGNVNTGGGDDIVLVASFDLGLDVFDGKIAGRLHTGSGDDVVINTGTIGDVNLGSGNDLYLALPGDGQLGASGRVLGGRGHDTMRGSEGNEEFFGGQGRDELEGNDGDDLLVGNASKDTLRGGEGDDVLIGGRGSDLLFGGQDDDTLMGKSGRDRLLGGRGDDTLEGGSGADTFLFSLGSGEDVIVDFTDDDVIRLPQETRAGAEPGAFAPVIGFDDIELFITYANGNAVIDLDGLYASVDLADLSNGQINSITLLNIVENSLTADDFGL
ncbi:calcium-binding protein [Tateyamaria sp. syn59]|uniref:calcium-binding protein n=1 Tax=Tateyamaria sp. syn59 TaxID=2576942 RepID=UPI001672BFBA|nr:calcium-binding protein [Tateyamaria sp. syn59]